MAETEEDKDWSVEMEKSNLIKLALAKLALSQGGEVILDPPFNQSGMMIERVLAAEKFGEDLAQFTAKLGGSGQPSYRLALFTTKERALFDDRSFKFKYWDCFPKIYHNLLLFVQAQINRPLEEEKPRKRR